MLQLYASRLPNELCKKIIIDMVQDEREDMPDGAGEPSKRLTKLVQVCHRWRVRFMGTRSCPSLSLSLFPLVHRWARDLPEHGDQERAAIDRL
jgi:hypothetical protein